MEEDSDWERGYQVGLKAGLSAVYINGSTSDGYHTFDELYEHRTLLLAAFLSENPDAWKSKLHSDGTMFDGMFIAGANLFGKQITYHQDMKYWGNFVGVRELDHAPKYDGHTPQDVIDRLREWLSV